MRPFDRKFPMQCPSCNHRLRVGKFCCPECETEVLGVFDLPPLLRLSEKEQAFIVDFVKSSGSLKDMAKNMGISYPTVRNLLDELIGKLNKLQ